MHLVLQLTTPGVLTGRVGYQPQTSSGSLTKAAAVARSAASTRSYRPVRASGKVGMPLSAETTSAGKYDHMLGLLQD
jgi:hypothetical protein